MNSLSYSLKVLNIVAAIFFSLNSFSQTVSKKYIDSLISKKVEISSFDKDEDITHLCNILFGLPEKEALYWYRYMDSISNGNKYMSLNLYSEYAAWLNRSNQNDKGHSLMKKGLAIAEDVNHPFYRFEYNQLMALHYIDKIMADSATYYINKAEKVILNHKKTLGKWLYRIYERKAYIENMLGDTDKGDHYLDLAVASTDTIVDNKEKAYIISSVVFHYKQQRNYLKHAHYTNKLKDYYIRKNGIDEPLPDHISYLTVFEDDQEQINTLKAQLKSLDRSYSKVSLVNVLADLLIANDNAKEALMYLQQFDQNNLKAYDYVVNLKKQENAYTNLNDYEAAFETVKVRLAIQDSLRQEDVLNKMADFRIEYDTERKETDLKLLAVENEKNKQQKWLYSIIAIGGLIATISIGFLLLKNKRVNNKLKATIAEKNTLLKETHHRVKNSFQIVSGLLFLKSSTIKDKAASKALKETQNRINSMAVLHQKLYKKEHISGIDCKEYITDLVSDILSSYSNPHIEKRLSIESITLDIDLVTSLGLIINELVTNCLKHAFTKDIINPYIEVNLYSTADDLILAIIDNGIGFSKEQKDEDSLGITLVKDLVSKINATLTFKNLQDKDPKGSKITILMEDYKSQK